MFCHCRITFGLPDGVSPHPPGHLCLFEESPINQLMDHLTPGKMQRIRKCEIHKN